MTSGQKSSRLRNPGTATKAVPSGRPFVGGESAYYLSVNRNKRSCAVNLKDPEGIHLVKQMAARFDVVIENFRPGTMERLGLDYQTLRAANPGLVYCSITGFGHTGPDARRPGYDLIVRGESGIIDITGDPDGPPTKIGTSIADLMTGTAASPRSTPASHS